MHVCIYFILYNDDYQIWYSAFFNILFVFFLFYQIADETRMALTSVHNSIKAQQSSYVFTPKYQLPQYI